MKHLIRIVFLLYAAAVAVACKEDTGSAPSVLTVEEQQMSISYRGGQNIIRYTVENPAGNTLPYAEPDQEWIHSFDYDSPDEIHFLADPNTNDGARTANITIYYAEAEPVIVTVRQLTSAEAGDALITILTESPVQVPAEGGDIEILYSIDNYVEDSLITMTSSEAWASEYDRPEYGKVIVHTQINFNSTSRTAELTFSYPNAEPVSVTLEQAVSDNDPAFTIIASEITETSAVVSWFPEDKGMYYANGLVPKSYMDAYEGRETEFIEDEVLNMQYQAEQQGITIQEYLNGVLHTGDKAFKWSTLEPDTDYCALAFGLSPDAEILTGLTIERFQTRKVDQLDCTFSFEDAGTTATSLKVHVTPDNPSVRYYTGIMSKSEYDSWGSDNDLMNMISDDIETWIWIYGQNPQLGITASWEDYTEIGECDVEADQLFSDTEYYAFAFGLDEGLITTNLQKQLFTTDEVEITDNCTFEVTATATSSYMADIEIIPSNSSTRYYVEIVESSTAAQYSLNDMATMMLNSAIESGLLDTYSYSGSQYLNTLHDMDVAPLTPSTDFTVFIFGTENGNRTTEVSATQFRTQALKPSTLTFDLSVTDVTTNSVTLQCTPSNNNEFFIMGCISVDQYNSYSSDAEFTQTVVDYYSQSLLGIYGAVGCMGETSRNTTTDIFYGELQDRTEYYAFAFGYMGDVTTGVTKLRFSTSGKAYSRADVTMECELINGADLYYEDPYQYPYEDYYNFAVFDFTLTPNQYADGWYFATINNASIDEVRRMDEEQLISILRDQGEYRPTTTRRREYWYTTIVAVVLPVDEYGEYGEMRIEEFYADPEAAGLLTPAASRHGSVSFSDAGTVTAGYQSVSPLRPWNGKELKEVPDNDRSRPDSPVMTEEEAVSALREYMHRRFPDSPVIDGNQEITRKMECTEVTL